MLLYSRSVHAISNAAYDASDNHVGRMKGTNLQYRTDSHNSGANQNSFLSPQSLTDCERHHGAKETTYVVDACDDGKKIRL